jgi:hypothetical protein
MEKLPTIQELQKINESASTDLKVGDIIKVNTMVRSFDANIEPDEYQFKKVFNNMVIFGNGDNQDTWNTIATTKFDDLIDSGTIEIISK